MGNFSRLLFLLLGLVLGVVTVALADPAQDFAAAVSAVKAGDVDKAMAWLLEHPDVGGLYNVGAGVARTWNDLAAAVFAAMERKPAIDYVDMPETLRGKYQYFTEAKMDRLGAAGYDRPFASLEDGVADYVRHYLATSDHSL